VVAAAVAAAGKNGEVLNPFFFQNNSLAASAVILQQALYTSRTTAASLPALGYRQQKPLGMQLSSCMSTVNRRASANTTAHEMPTSTTHSSTAGTAKLKLF